MTEAARVRTLRLLLRVAGGFIVTAFLTVLLPVEWMASTHQWLGLGQFPRAPVVDYLARSVAALYGFHGVLLLLVSRDLVRYRPIIAYVSVWNVTLGFLLIAIGLHAGMPRWWIISEGPPIVAFGLVLALLNRSSPRYRP